MLKTTIKDGFDELNNFMIDKKEHFMIGVSAQNEVSYGGEDDINKEYCDANNIPYYFMDRNGGAIVCFKNNISLAYIYNNQIRGGFIFVDLIKELYNYLKEKNLDVNLEHNDILIDGFKVAGCHGYNLKPDYLGTYEGMQISIDVDVDLIKNICKKEMKKIPKALSEYGITKEEILNFIYNGLERRNIVYE